MLEAAQGIDDIHLRVRPKERKKPAKPANDREADTSAEEEEEEEDTHVPDESPSEFIARLNLYVAIHLARSPKNNRDSYKDGLVYQARKDLINEFLKSCMLKKCQNSDCSWWVWAMPAIIEYVIKFIR